MKSIVLSCKIFVIILDRYVTHNERWTIVDKESTIYNRLDLPAYTSGNTFSFLVYEGRDKRFDPPCEMSRKQFSQQNRTRYELPFLLSFLCLLDSSMAWSMVRPAALFTSSVTRVSLSLLRMSLKFSRIFNNFQPRFVQILIPVNLNLNLLIFVE